MSYKGNIRYLGELWGIPFIVSDPSIFDSIGLIDRDIDVMKIGEMGARANTHLIAFICSLPSRSLAEIDKNERPV